VVSAYDTVVMATEIEMTKPMWRFLGEFRQAKSREEIRSQTLEGWDVWSKPWCAHGDKDIVVPDLNDTSRRRYAQVRYAERDSSVFTFAVDYLEAGWRFYVPASQGEMGAFEAPEVQYEGFWRISSSEESDLPWPEPEDNWTGRAELLACLDRAETSAERVRYRGYSFCRLCDCANGSESLRLSGWEWPAGFRHYIAEHCVRPTFAFEQFILSQKSTQSRSGSLRKAKRPNPIVLK
jgi:hypothetical protein